MKRIALLVWGVSALIGAIAQDSATSHYKRLRHTVSAALNIGGTSPVGLPNTIRKIESYNPLFNPMIGYGIAYRVNDKWEIESGLRLEYKGMKVQDSVIYFHTLITMESNGEKSEFEGDFSGHNSTRVHNLYLSLPLVAAFQPGKFWRYRLGLYFAFLLSPKFDGTVNEGYIRKGNSLGEKVTITEASFDFEKIERTFDFGIQAGVERSIGKKFTAFAQLNWGLRPIFPSDFKGMDFPMYNIYATFGVSYQLF